MNAFSDGNVDVKTTSLQKAKFKGRTKEAMRPTRRGKEENMRITFCCFFHKEIRKKYNCTQRCYFPKTQEMGNEEWPRGMRKGRNVKLEDGPTEKQPERNIIPPGTGATPSINRELK